MKMKNLIVLLSVLIACFSCQTMMRKMGVIPMGGDDDVRYANELWQALDKAQLVGNNAKPTTPIFGGASML